MFVQSPSTEGGAVTGGGTVGGAISTVAVPVEGKRKSCGSVGISQPLLLAALEGE